MSEIGNAGMSPVGFEVGRDELAAALAYVAGGVPSRPAVPVLGGVLITADGDGTVTVATFDYEQARTVTLDGTAVTAPGRVLVGCKALHDIVKKLPAGKKGTKTRPAVPAPAIRAVATGARLTLTVGTARFGLDTMPVEDYPELPKLPATVGTIDGAALASAAARLAVSAGKDDTLPVLTGIYFQGGGRYVEMESTDRYRLGAADLDWTPANPDREAYGPVTALIPARTLTSAAKVFGKAGTVEVGRGGESLDGTLSLSWGDGAWTLWTRTLDGKFPKVRGLFADEYRATVLVDRAALVAKVELIATTLDRAAPVRLILDGDTITVRGGGEWSESAGSESVPAQIRANGRLVAGFNHAYLLDGLKAVGTERVSIGFTEGEGMCRKPAVICPTDADGTTTPGYRYLIMPIRLDEGVDKDTSGMNAAKASESIARKQAEPAADPAAAEAIEKREAKRAADADQAAAKTTAVRKARTRKVVAAVVAEAAAPVEDTAPEPVAEPAAEPVQDTEPVTEPGGLSPIVGAPDGGQVWVRLTTSAANTNVLREIAKALRTAIFHTVTLPANKGHKGDGNILAVSVYRDAKTRTLAVTAYPPAGRELPDVEALRLQMVETAGNVSGIVAVVPNA